MWHNLYDVVIIWILFTDKWNVLFCLKACRGRRYDWGVEVPDADVDMLDSDVPDGPSMRKIPVEADFFMAYSVSPGKHNIFLADSVHQKTCWSDVV